MSKVYIGRISERTRERDLEEAFSKYGKIHDINVKRGFAFIAYADPRDASDAIRAMDGVEFDGSRIIVEISRGGAPKERDRERNRERDRGSDRDRERYSRDADRDRRFERPKRGPPSYSTENRILVEGLPSGCDWRDLKDLMRDHVAPPTYADVNRDGVGSVHFEKADDVRRAIKELSDTKFKGVRITVKEDTSTGGNNNRSDRYHPYSRDSGRRRSPSPRRRSRSPSPKRSPSHRSTP